MKKKEKDKLFENIPGCAAEFIKLVIKKMRYRKKVRADVQAELAAHFEDELKNCATDQEKEQKAQKLIEDFGDVKLLGILLRRAKKRCRPLWRTIVARTFQTIGILILCFIVYVVWFLSGKPVITTDYIAELNRIVQPVADESLNAAPLYEKALKLYEEKSSDEILDLLGTKYNEATDEQKKLIAKWLEDNKEILDLVIAGTNKPYYWPKYEEGTAGKEGEGLMGILMPHLSGFRRLAYALRWRIHLRAEQGQYKDAFEDVKSCYCLGRHLMGDKTLIEQLVGIAIRAVAIQTLREVLGEYEIDSSILATLQKDFEQIIASEDFVVSLRTEKLCMYDELQRCFTEDRLGEGHLYLPRLRALGGPLGGQGEGRESMNKTGMEDFLDFLGDAVNVFFKQPNKQQTLKAANEYYDYCEQLAVKTAAQFHTESEDIDRKLEKFFSNNIFLNLLAPSLRRVIEISNRLPADIDSTLTVIAILRYKQDKGNFPESLDELITAGYLKELPMDPWSDKPLIYKRTEDNFILYSVGLNFKDDGGQVYRDKKGKPQLWHDEFGDAVFWPVAK